MRKRYLDRCWEYMRCEVEKECEAYPDAGEMCWMRAGTMRSSYKEKKFKELKNKAENEGRQLTEKEISRYKPKNNCIYIEKYTHCHWCVYYNYIKKMKKELGEDIPIEL